MPATFGGDILIRQIENLEKSFVFERYLQYVVTIIPSDIDCTVMPRRVHEPKSEAFLPQVTKERNHLEMGFVKSWSSVVPQKVNLLCQAV